MKKYMNIVLFFIIATIVGCSKEAKTPEGLVKLYVEEMTSNKMSKDFFLANSDGELKAKIEAMSDEEFEKYKNVTNIKSVKVNIVNTTCREEKCSVKYIVSYDVYTNTKNSFSTEVKKIAKVVKVEGKWKLADITNMKTYHESKEVIGVTPTSK